MPGPLIDLEGQIAEVRREIAFRRAFYPRMIAKRRMQSREAQARVDHMEAVLATLLELRRRQRREPLLEAAGL